MFMSLFIFHLKFITPFLSCIRFDGIADITAPKQNTLQILLRTGSWVTLYTPKVSKCHLVLMTPSQICTVFTQATQIRDLVEKFIMESFKSDVEFVRAIEDHTVKQGNLLSFRKGDIIRIIRNSNMHISKGKFSFFSLSLTTDFLWLSHMHACTSCHVKKYLK